MTEISSDNFEEMFPTIADSIRKATFIAIDTELTGLVAEESAKPSLFDSVDERYRKQRLSVSRFIVCQLGLTTFTREAFENRYTAKCFTFNICPRSVCESRDKPFCIEPAAVEFLCNFNFDFNKFARKGIPYLNQKEEAKLRKQMRDDMPFDMSSPITNEISKACSSIFSWLGSKGAKRGDTSGDAGPIDLSKEKRIPFKRGVNSFTNFLFLKELRSNFTTVWIELDDEGLVVRVVSPEECQRLEGKAKIEEEEAAINYLTGFSRVFGCLVEARKPLIGHNMILDLLHLYHHFFKPLPKSLQAFKRDIHSVFPIIFDTKCMFLNARREFLELRDMFDVTSLSELYLNLSSQKFLLSFMYQPIIEQLFNELRVSRAEFLPHDAGFDSFATGYVFLRLTHGLTMSNRRCPKLAPSWSEYIKNLKPHCNRINLIRATIHSLNLEGEDIKSNRPNWLFVEKKVGRLPLSSVVSMMSIYGTVDVKPVNAFQALVAVGNYRAAYDIVKAFREDKQYKVSQYNVFKHDKNVRNILWGSFLLTSCFSAILIVKLLKSN